MHTQAIAEASVEQAHDGLASVKHAHHHFFSLALPAGVGHALGGGGASEEAKKDSHRGRSNVVSSGSELRGRSNVACSTHIPCPDARKGEHARKPPTRGGGGRGGGLSVSANPKRRSVGDTKEKDLSERRGGDVVSEARARVARKATSFGETTEKEFYEKWLHPANKVAGGGVSGDAGEEWRAPSARAWSARALNWEGGVGQWAVASGYAERRKMETVSQSNCICW